MWFLYQNVLYNVRLIEHIDFDDPSKVEISMASGNKLDIKVPEDSPADRAWWETQLFTLARTQGDSIITVPEV